MGMYTEFHFNVELEEGTPQAVIDILTAMVGGDVSGISALPDHPFFSTPRWRFLFTMDSYYFAADTVSSLRLDAQSQNRYLCVRSNLKNYDREIEHFIDWINPWVDASEGEFLGFHRYEEDDDPAVIRKLPKEKANA